MRDAAGHRRFILRNLSELAVISEAIHTLAGRGARVSHKLYAHYHHLRGQLYGCHIRRLRNR